MRAHFRLRLPGVAATLLLLLSCGGATSSSPALPGNPNSPCPRPPRPSFYSSQILFGADTQDGTHLLWAYKVDNETGALEEMPWSPLPTARGPRAGTGDSQGRFLYLGSAGVGTPSRVLEVYELSTQTEIPEQVEVRQFGFTRQLEFDPSGTHLYALDALSALPGESTLHSSTLHTFAVNCDGTLREAGPAGRTDRTGTSFGFKNSAQYVLTARENESTFVNGVDVFRRDAASGVLAHAASFSFTETAVRFIAVPESSPFFIGTNCAPSPGQAFGAQVFAFDAAGLNIDPVANSYYPSICQVFFDRGGQYLAAIERSDVENLFSSRNGLAVYRMSQTTGALLQTERLSFWREDGRPQTLSRVVFDLNNRFLYVSAIATPNVVYGFAFDQGTGTLTPVPGSPFAVPKLFSPMFIVGQP